MKNINNFENGFSDFKYVFCDSVEAIQWAYKHGLDTNTIIKTNSPSVVWGNKDVFRMDSRWNVTEMREFQRSIGKLSRLIFDSVKLIEGLSHEEALCVASVFVSFQKVLFKAACLTNDDVSKPVLFIRVGGSGGPNGNNMNPPWERLFKGKDNLTVITYDLNTQWDTLNTKSISWYRRIKLGGIETLVYRIMLRLSKIVTKKLFCKSVFIYRENELVIDTAAHLVKHGVRIEKIKMGDETHVQCINNLPLIKDYIKSIVKERVSNYVIPEIRFNCEKMFFQDLEKQLLLFYKLRSKWRVPVELVKKENGIILTNHPSSFPGFAITSVCREIGVPVISAQHGVTPEICDTTDEVEVVLDANASDCYLAYNPESAKIVESSHFSRGKSYLSGISSRHLRMSKYSRADHNRSSPLVYISTNVYRGNISAFCGWITDYDRSIKEKDLVNKVFSKLPHNVRYKTYPEDNRRYSDVDPVFEEIQLSKNIELYVDKVDMRYLIGQHRILMTSRATSTLGWVVMSKKPVVFINWKENNPLTTDAEKFFKKGLFLFNDDDDDFHEKLRKFLSKPIFEIEAMWDLKESDRKKMAARFFSAYYSNAGKRSAKMIVENFFK